MKKHRRGKRGSGQSAKGEHMKHWAAAHDALRQGDHQAAKGHAFRMIKALGAALADGEEPREAMDDEPSDDAGMMQESAVSAEKPTKKPSQALAALLARRMKQKA